MATLKNTLLQISQYGMGRGDEQLGVTLLTNYLKLINEESEPPRFIALYNSGVKLVCKGSPAIPMLNEIEQKGVKIIVCTTCLKHFNLVQDQEVGIAGTMMDIVELQKVAEKVINL